LPSESNTRSVVDTEVSLTRPRAGTLREARYEINLASLRIDALRWAKPMVFSCALMSIRYAINDPRYANISNNAMNSLDSIMSFMASGKYKRMYSIIDCLIES